jgi:hypothetical protein
VSFEVDTGVGTRRKAWKKTSKQSISHIEVVEKLKSGRRKRSRHRSPIVNDEESAAVENSSSQSETKNSSPKVEHFNENNNEKDSGERPVRLLRKFRKHLKLCSESKTTSPPTTSIPSVSPNIEPRY